MNSLGNDGPTTTSQPDSGADAAEEEEKPAPPKKKSGRKPPKKSDAAATAAAELEKEIQKAQDAENAEEEEEGDDDNDSDGKPTAVKSGGKGNSGGMLVDHTYTNYAILSDKELRLLDEHSSLLPEAKSEEERVVREKLRGMSCTYGPMKKSAGGVVSPFPGKLMDVLDRSDLIDIISWMPHGRAFIVKKVRLFFVVVYYTIVSKHAILCLKLLISSLHSLNYLPSTSSPASSNKPSTYHSLVS